MYTPKRQLTPSEKEFLKGRFTDLLINTKGKEKLQENYRKLTNIIEECIKRLPKYI